MRKVTIARGGRGGQQVAEAKRRLRILVLLAAAEEAGLVPLPILRLHAFAYLANVLAPVWEMPVQEGKALKLQGGPFYPSLQRELDHLVGLGLIQMSGLGYLLDEADRWRLDGSYRLSRAMADPILKFAQQFEDERETMLFIQELAYALAALSDEELDKVTKEDATYSDPLVDVGNVIDFGEWRNLNFSANAAQKFDRLLSENTQATLGEKLHFYVRHLRTRLHGGR